MQNNNWLTEEEHRWMTENVVFGCVDVLVIHNGNYLLCKRAENPAKSQFWMPGGRILKGETVKDCALRICEREIGQKVKYIRALGFTETIFKESRYDGVGVHTLNAIVVVEAPSNKIKLDESHSDYRWISFAHRIKNLHPELDRILDEYFTEH